MRLLVSSKAFSNSLKEIDFQSESINSLGLKYDKIKASVHSPGILTVTASKTEVEIPVEIRNYGLIEDQNPGNARWDWVYGLLKVVSEQPVVLEISKGRVQVIFQY